MMHVGWIWHDAFAKKIGGPPCAQHHTKYTKLDHAIDNGHRARFVENRVVITMIKLLQKLLVIMGNEVTHYFRLHFDRCYLHCGWGATPRPFRCSMTSGTHRTSGEHDCWLSCFSSNESRRCSSTRLSQHWLRCIVSISHVVRWRWHSRTSPWSRPYQSRAMLSLGEWRGPTSGIGSSPSSAIALQWRGTKHPVCHSSGSRTSGPYARKIPMSGTRSSTRGPTCGTFWRRLCFQTARGIAPYGCISASWRTGMRIIVGV
jgi:hypothetical protein